MSHELTIRRSGKVEMAYVGEKPWHGLGTEMALDASIDEWIEGAGMEWTAEALPMHYVFNGEDHEITDRVVLARSDNGMPLGTVSTGYKPVQPRETLEFFRDLIEGLGLQMATAGTIFAGRRMWAAGFIGEQSVVDDRDLVNGYLLVSTSLDGSMATTTRFTSTRVVCRNTLDMARLTDAAVVRVVHSTKFDAAAAKEAMGVAPKTFETFMSQMRSLAKVQVGELQAAELTEKLVESNEGRVYEKIMGIFSGDLIGADLSGGEGTAWAWLNSVTQFVDHDRKAKSDSHRLSSQLFGRGADMKARARDLALALV